MKYIIKKIQTLQGLVSGPIETYYKCSNQGDVWLKSLENATQYDSPLKAFLVMKYLLRNSSSLQALNLPGETPLELSVVDSTGSTITSHLPETIEYNDIKNIINEFALCHKDIPKAKITQMLYNRLKDVKNLQHINLSSKVVTAKNIHKLENESDKRDLLEGMINMI